jgi:hypothetical protein
VYFRFMRASRRTGRLWLVLLALMVTTQVVARAEANGTRMALVVGVGAYEGNILPNAGPDAADVDSALRELGFTTIYIREPTKDGLISAIQQFGHSLGQAQVGLFYFAGHAVQLRGNNYLLPMGAQLRDLADVPREAVDLQAVFKVLSDVPLTTRIILIDACRANPFPRSFMSGLPASQDWAPGLAQPPNAPPATVIGFSTKPGGTAEDGKGAHSPYTQAILKYIKQPGLPLDAFFQSVRNDVVANTTPPQIPWEVTSLQTPFYFREPAAIEAVITDGDDDVYLNVNGSEILSWTRDGGHAKRVQLNTGRNEFTVDVYNQHTMTPGLFRVPEGWRYKLQLTLSAQVNLNPNPNPSIVLLGAEEDIPVLDGPHHGKRFRVVSGVLFVNSETAEVSLTSLDTQVPLKK